MTEVFVFAARERADAHALSFGSLRSSDIGEKFTVLRQPEELKPEEHWRAVHERAAKATSEFVLVLEDDVLVNTHILHNIATWRYKHDARVFGAGWVYSPGGYSQKDCWYSGDWEWHGTCGVLYKTERLPFLIERAWPRIMGGRPWDCAMAWACHLDGKRIRVHFPSLVEHLYELPSKVGTVSGARRHSGGTFRQDWRRSELGDPHGTVDQFGRKVV